MNFTADYISLCKNDKVQGLRKELKTGDWVYGGLLEQTGQVIGFMDKDYGVFWVNYEDYGLEGDEISASVNKDTIREDLIWLPTGDQLDYEVLKICRKKFGRYFQYEMCFITTEWYGSISYWKESEEYMKDCQKLRYAIQIKENPLIAKIKLLLSLLESEE